MPLGLGIPELLIVLVIVLIFVGPKKLPGLGKSLGTGMREFKESVTGNDKDDPSAIEPNRETAPPVAPQQTAAPVVAPPVTPQAPAPQATTPGEPPAPADPAAPQHPDR